MTEIVIFIHYRPSQQPINSFCCSRLSAASPVHNPAEYNSGQGTDQCRRQCRPYNCCWIHAAILASVGDHINRYQLKGGDIYNQKGTHFITGRF